MNTARCSGRILERGLLEERRTRGVTAQKGTRRLERRGRSGEVAPARQSHDVTDDREGPFCADPAMELSSGDVWITAILRLGRRGSRGALFWGAFGVQWRRQPPSGAGWRGPLPRLACQRAAETSATPALRLRRSSQQRNGHLDEKRLQRTRRWKTLPRKAAPKKLARLLPAPSCSRAAESRGCRRVVVLAARSRPVRRLLHAQSGGSGAVDSADHGEIAASVVHRRHTKASLRARSSQRRRRWCRLVRVAGRARIRPPTF